MNRTNPEELKEVWVILVGLPIHLWEFNILKKPVDACGGFIAVDKSTMICCAGRGEEDDATSHTGGRVGDGTSSALPKALTWRQAGGATVEEQVHPTEVVIGSPAVDSGWLLGSVRFEHMGLKDLSPIFLPILVEPTS